MKTLLALLLLIPSLGWGNNMKYLLCYNNLYELQNIGLKLNTNTKLFTSYHIKQADGEYFLNSYLAQIIDTLSQLIILVKIKSFLVLELGVWTEKTYLGAKYSAVQLDQMGWVNVK